jgi:hypothetical protein
MSRKLRAAWPAVLRSWCLGLGLASCTAPPEPVATAPAVNLQALLQQAEAKGYDEGLAAGKRIQARKDHALAAKPEAPPPPAPAMAEATPPPAPPAPAVPAAEPPPPDGFSPQGPAVPLMSPNAGGI